ncbi:MAG: membrane protein insertase YidC [Solobacterium sp.]|jgi:YidC/Oxa1 family membrane protein insertase|nr:membrane protein insertase YidC [Solobacterium sp.]MCH4221874.1 membrane protein insertase YidC [Solobacterium sp.]MCH4265197.1 membrane protein insertase YidC [Solobacterium sp.]
MKLSASTKKILALSAVAVVAAVVLTGCSAPTVTNADGTTSIKVIDLSTTFNETMSSENWFNAIFVWPLAQVLNFLEPKIGVVGAIAILTICVNLILMLATLKSTIASQQMQLLQPELDHIQRKYEGREDDASKMKQANEMQALYKKYNVNPFSMLLVTFLQFPIIIAMYQAVERASAIKYGTFLGLSLETTPWNGMKSGQWLYLLIFAVMGVCQFFSMMTPQILAKKKAAAEAEKHHRKPEAPKGGQQKIMQYYMMAMILVFGLMWPTAMSIYWSIYSLVTIVKTLLVQKIIDNKQKEGAIK